MIYSQAVFNFKEQISTNVLSLDGGGNYSQDPWDVNYKDFSNKHRLYLHSVPCIPANKCFTRVNILMKQTLHSSPFYRWGNWGPKRLNILSQVIQLVVMRQDLNPPSFHPLPLSLCPSLSPLLPFVWVCCDLFGPLTGLFLFYTLYSFYLLLLSSLSPSVLPITAISASHCSP